MRPRFNRDFGSITDLLDQEVWDAPRRLSRDDCLDHTGGPCRRERDIKDDSPEDEPR